jgi:hypothetical protein
VLEDGALVVLEGELRPTPGPLQILLAVKACVAEVSQPFSLPPSRLYSVPSRSSFQSLS